MAMRLTRSITKTIHKSLSSSSLSNHQKTNPHTSDGFILQLSAYGLDPEDWQIGHMSGSTAIAFVNKFDEGFRFQAQVGRTKNGQAELRSLKLISL